MEIEDKIEISSFNSEHYSEKDFWDDRFKKYTFKLLNIRTDGLFDWYVGWKELKNIFKEYLNLENKILMVGCGNSGFF